MYDGLMREMGRRILELRLARNLSQRDVARLSREAAPPGVSDGYVSLIEKGKMPNPGKRRLDAIASALGFAHFQEMMASTDPASPSVTVNPSPASARATAADPIVGIGASSQRGQFANIRGRVDELRDSQVRPLPVYRWGAAGDPRSAENAPDPDRLEFPPLGRELLIGPRGFAVDVRGDSMVKRNIRDGDTVWVNPDRAPRVGGVVVAHAWNDDGDEGMVVKVLVHDGVGELLMSDPEGEEQMPVDSDYFEVIGPVVWIQPPGYPPG